jgi:glycine cleavage system H protein
MVNDEPYGKGWLFRVKLASPGDLDELLDAEGYMAEVAE